MRTIWGTYHHIIGTSAQVRARVRGWGWGSGLGCDLFRLFRGDHRIDSVQSILLNCLQHDDDVMLWSFTPRDKAGRSRRVVPFNIA